MLFGSIAVVYGQTGLGKSTLLKPFFSQIPLNPFLPIYVHFTHVKTSSLFALAVSQLDEYRNIPTDSADEA